MTSEIFLSRINLINDQTRLKILQILADRGTVCACKILEELDITQGTLSHHMKLLVNAGLVSVKKGGKWSHYTLVKEELVELASYLLELTK